MRCGERYGHSVEKETPKLHCRPRKYGPPKLRPTVPTSTSNPLAEHCHSLLLSRLRERSIEMLLRRSRPSKSWAEDIARHRAEEDTTVLPIFSAISPEKMRKIFLKSDDTKSIFICVYQTFEGSHERSGAVIVPCPERSAA
jgi:hypothetical protein